MANPNLVKRESVAVDPLAILANQLQEQEPELPKDDLEAVVTAFLLNCRISPLAVNEVSSDVAGMQELAQAGAWKHVVDLSESSSFFTSETLVGSKLPFAAQFRLKGLFRMKQFDELAQDALNILSEEEKLSQSSESPINDTVIALRLLLAEIKVMTGHGEEGIEQLSVMQHVLAALHAACETPDSRIRIHNWCLRVQCSTINYYVRQRQWRLAVAELNKMLENVRKQIAIAQTQVGTETGARNLRKLVNSDIIIQCVLSRTLMQVGAMKASELYCEGAWKLCTAGMSVVDQITRVAHRDDPRDTVWEQVQLTRGIVLFGRNKFEDAMEIFQGVMDRHHAKEGSGGSPAGAGGGVAGSSPYVALPPPPLAAALGQPAAISKQQAESFFSEVISQQEPVSEEDQPPPCPCPCPRKRNGP